MDEKVKVQFTVEVEKCCYWDFENHKTMHDCGSCWCRTEGNNIENAKSGVMIGKDRYCTLGVNVYAEIVEALKNYNNYNNF